MKSRVSSRRKSSSLKWLPQSSHFQRHGSTGILLLGKREATCIRICEPRDGLRHAEGNARHMDPRYIPLGQGFFPLLAHTPWVLSLPSHWNGPELYKWAQILWSHVQVRQGRATRDPTCKRLWISGPLLFRLVLHAAQMGKGYLAGFQFLASFHRWASYWIHSQPPGNKAHFLYLEFPKMKWRDWVASFLNHAFNHIGW